MEERLQALEGMELPDRVRRLERRDLAMFRLVKRGVRAVYVAAGMLIVLALQGAGVDVVSRLLTLIP